MVTESEPYFEFLSRTMPRAFERELFFVGVLLKRGVREAFRKRQAGMVKWKGPSGIRDRKNGKGIFRSRSQRIGGKLPSASGFDTDGTTLRFGWLSRTAAMYGNQFERGKVTPVTPFMRKRYFGSGIPVGSVIVQPKRPLFRPLYESKKGEIMASVEKGMRKQLDRGVRKATATARRTFKVVG